MNPGKTPSEASPVLGDDFTMSMCMQPCLDLTRFLAVDPVVISSGFNSRGGAATKLFKRMPSDKSR